MQVLHSDKKMGDYPPNLATMLRNNAESLADKNLIGYRTGESFTYLSWGEFFTNVSQIAKNLRKSGFRKGDKMVLFSANSPEMMQMEMAVMASGGIAVPIFAGFKKETAELLIRHSAAGFLAVGSEKQLSELSDDLPLNGIFILANTVTSNHEHPGNLQHFADLLATEPGTSELRFDAPPDEICLNMYTSGTMGTPKCVQLTHRNILSQQASMSELWKVGESDRFLSYLPWHHSFGGIFEMFACLYNGSSMALENSFGKDEKLIFENWSMVQPTLFFSVPKVYQALVEMTKESKKAERLFFHSGLKFIFTAASPLPEQLSREFEKRNIPVMEGWGLTETSPCCTITDPRLKRQSGVVGKPIPGVSLALSPDSEILVKGPNVMVGYYDNEEANQNTFTDDGWFRTGDIGEFAETGLKLISRKDRIFKLSNGEKVIPTEMEALIQNKCHYISFALVEGGGKEYPVALLFPNKKMLDSPDYEISPFEGCFCPRNLEELGRCLQGCLQKANLGTGQKFAKIRAAMIVDDALSIEKSTLTPSMKLAPKNVMKVYKAHLENLYGAQNDVKEEVYVIRVK